MDGGMKKPTDHTSFELGVYQARVEDRLAHWADQKLIQRLWHKDYTLWSAKPKADIVDRLGWLTLPDVEREALEGFVSFAEEVRSDGFAHVALLGMGGSSLAPEVFARSFGGSPGYPELTVLDSTHPEVVRSLAEHLPLTKTLFCVSSKSGTTLETLSLFRYFWSRLNQLSEKPGDHFVAITDPGSSLERLANDREFRAVFTAPPDVGGRYSALTEFGLVPAALIGVDIHRLLASARDAAESCLYPRSDMDAIGIVLGATLGEFSSDRNKITLMTTPSLISFSDWVEQLVAESTGKDGKGILPVVLEPPGPAKEYSEDRLFIGLFLEGENDGHLERFFDELSDLGHPVVRIYLKDKYDLGREFFQWEVAVATAGAAMGINPFDQPDVQLAKDFTQKIMDDTKGVADGMAIAQTLEVSDSDSSRTALQRWLSQARRGDYIALQAFLLPDSEITHALQIMRKNLMDHTHLATTLGFGPRFLHSTGQLHKGGPNNGLFLQIVDDPEHRLDVPETNLTFNHIIHAQAVGDFQALIERRRRVLRVDLRKDVIKGLEALQKLILL
jgi:transaldolase/glucose-6-phosphate isomerase